MKEKLGAMLFCLAFAIPFGGVGVGACYAIYATVRDAERAKDWVRVKADVESFGEGRVLYRYVFQGQRQTGERLGSNALGGTDNIDSWHEDMEAYLGAAKSEAKPILVWVNPDNPSESMVDRELRWKLLVFMLPFALAFGGVGAGALWMIVKTLRGGGPIDPKTRKPQARKSEPRRTIASDQRSAMAGLWLFGFFWNAISFPIAILAVPDIVRNGEWLGLLVLLFPLVGVLILWAAINATVSYLRRGGAKVELREDNPRVGGAVEGHVAFPRGVMAGQQFRVKLVCIRGGDDGDGGTSWGKFWAREVEARTTSVGGNVRLPFRFETPANLPATTDTNDVTTRYAWRVEVKPVSSGASLPYNFDVQMRPAAMVGSTAPAFVEDEMPAAVGPQLENVERMFAGTGATLTRQQMQVLAKLSPEQRQNVKRLLEWAPTAKRVAIGAVVLFFVVQVLMAVIGMFN